MSLSGLSRAKNEVVADLLHESGVAVIRLQDGLASALVMFGNHMVPAGRTLPIAEAPGIPAAASIGSAIGGRKAADGSDVPRSAAGDVLILERAAIHEGTLHCGRVLGRMHDGMEGKVQVMRILARPSGIKVTEHGAFQFVTLLDPGGARKVSTPEDFLRLAQEGAARRWPGGTSGFLLRNASKPFASMNDVELRENALVFPEDREPTVLFAKRMTETNGLLENGAVEAMPAFSLPLSRDHMYREGVDLSKPRSSSRPGNVSSLYAVNSKYRGFAPSLVIVGMDDEWAFRAKTGKKAPVCFALQPLGAPMEPRAIHSPVRGKADRISKTLSLYKDDAEATAAMEARAARKPRPAPAQAAPRPATQPPKPGVLGNLPRRPLPPVRPVPTPR